MALDFLSRGVFSPSDAHSQFPVRAAPRAFCSALTSAFSQGFRFEYMAMETSFAHFKMSPRLIKHIPPGSLLLPEQLLP